MTSQLKPCRPHCDTCGKDVHEVLCPTCAKWWHDNPPPSTPDTDLLHRIAEAMKERAAQTFWTENAYPVEMQKAIRAIDTAALVKDVCDAE